MRLKVLTDNNTYIDEYYLGEPALSFYIEDEDKKILFDVGYSDVFLKNAKKMNINLNNLDYLVLSHGHNDHTGGLLYLKNKDLSKTKLLAHKDVFIGRKDNGLNIGCPIKLEDLKVKEYINGINPYKISDNLYYLGQIKRITSFENKPIGIKEDGNPDYLYDDSALVYKGKEGLFIITACSHSGICNIILNAKELFPNNKIIGIIGGFHLLKDDEQLKETIKFLKQEKINELYPCHCVSLYAKHLLYDVSKVNEVGVGLEINIE